MSQVQEMARLSAGGACLLRTRADCSSRKAHSLGPGSPCLLGPYRSSTLLLLHFLLTYQIEIGLLYKNLPENIMYERHTPSGVFSVLDLSAEMI